ncbi:MAG: branched-chain amino acid ABC transporter permease [Rhodoferax sp.]|nr:branched-chain amino acid ABC transporter permease [Rhodoferax sp.]
MNALSWIQRSSTTFRARVLMWIVVAAVVAIIPLSATTYSNSQLSLVVSFAVAILGLNLVTGYAGQVSLGHSAFLGLGAYSAAIATAAGWPAPAAFAMACLVSGAVGLLVGLPALRLGGHSLAMVTLALPVVAVPLAKRLTSLTGGSTGISATPLHAPAWTGLAPDQWSFYVLAALAAFMFFLAGNLTRGRLGRALSLIRVNETVAASVGVPVYAYKVQAFVCAALFGGVAGFMYVCAIGFMSPESLNLLIGLNLLIAMVVGGMRSLLGSLIGGAFYVFLPELVSYAGTTRSGVINIATGICVLLVIFLSRGGAASIVSRIWKRIHPKV